MEEKSKEETPKLVMEEKSKEGTSKPVVEEQRKEGNKLAKENESNKQVDNKKKRVKHFSCNGGQESNVSLLSGLAFVLSALSMFVFRKNYLRSK